MGYRILISAPYMLPVIDRFRPFFDEKGCELIVPSVNERLEEDELLEFVADIDGAICGDDRFTEWVLRQAPKLKVLSKWGTGINSIDREACMRLGIVICNTPNAFSEPVADTVLGYVLCFARQLPWMNEQIRAGIWQKPPGRALRECTLGIIGVGNVGKVVAKRANAFGMRVLGNDPVQPDAEFLARYGVEMVQKDHLLERADFVSINCDLNPTSFHLMSDREFELMKRSAVLVNTARGPIIDEQALVRALQTEKIAGAALDVFEEEPLPINSPLRQMGNVMLAPHNANSSPEAWERVHLNTIKNLIDVLEKAT